MIPCQNATLDDINTKIIVNEYLPKAIDEDVLGQDKRELKEQMASLRLFDLRLDCPTYACIILFGKNPKYFLPGNYVQFVRFAGEEKASDIENEKSFNGNLWEVLPKLDALLDYSIIEQRPVAVSTLKEKIVFNYPQWAIRELLMNAVMHRDYQSNTPVRLYQFAGRVEIMNAGGLYENARPENFPTVNDYRNPNKFNRGVDRVQTVLKENGNPLAEFTVDKLTVFEVIVEESKSNFHGGTKSFDEIRMTILEFCQISRSLSNIARELGYSDKAKFKAKYINPLLGNQLQMTLPDTPISKFQMYKTIL
ncbi:MAG: Fic family protein [Tannerellaceae bacterium]